MSSSMMFYAGMEKERGQGGSFTKKRDNVSLALCLYLYVVCSVQILSRKHSQLGLGRGKKRAESEKMGNFSLQPGGDWETLFIHLQLLMFLLFSLSLSFLVSV